MQDKIEKLLKEHNFKFIHHKLFYEYEDSGGISDWFLQVKSRDEIADEMINVLINIKRRCEISIENIENDKEFDSHYGFYGPMAE